MKEKFKIGDKVFVKGNGDGEDVVMHYFDMGEECTIDVLQDIDGDYGVIKEDGRFQYINRNHLQLLNNERN